MEKSEKSEKSDEYFVDRHVAHTVEWLKSLQITNVPMEVELELIKQYKDVCMIRQVHFHDQGLNPSFAIHKLLLAQGHDQYLEYFPLPKSKSKLEQNEQLWERIKTHLKK